ncbi:hypothetical protein G6F57_011158 [Rhizopus arrhizus]|uniref:Uncharacterized protein n=1 Tax=Rhizopus oryzae TaxID=64495 RepID=A0A9P7BMP7_RHIOR|nr:hypothetical protein G6F24_011029 [Rhizopus arrhizus]KAG0782699.1 hypothetical protein G6F21_010968 [Rhizopus arrhizus]KAG0822675.1 hypothetical protein G6F19_011231 [Rhizopus arrhizus]KAG0849001.1 hypothetical protein G6F17_011152 [Rhizopus arrhizus]KAG0871682.1 hypothetical protein G6F15_011325 [Rhizopus arrhizus]
MLVSSNTVDKDSIHLRMHNSLRTHHRAMMASLSKLVLSAQSAHDDQRILLECNELMSTAKHFVSTCQELAIPLVPVDPQFNQVKEDEANALAPTHNHTNTNRYSLQLNLAENLETMGASIQDSAETITKYVSSWIGGDKNSLVVLLFTHFRNLSNQTGLFLAYLDETDFSSVLDQSEMKDLKQGKQALSDALGLLFIKLQAMTDEHLPDFDLYLKDIRESAAALFGPIEMICASVLYLATKNKSRNNSSASGILLSKKLAVAEQQKKESIIAEEEEIEEEPAIKEEGLEAKEEKQEERIPPLERHQSEVVQSANQKQVPPTIQRSQTTPSSDKIKKFFGDDAPVEAVSTKAPVSERPDFLQYDYGPNDIVFNMEGNVKGGTLPALVERLTMHDYFDMNFVNTFLLTYRSFCTSMELLDLLEARYNLKCPEGLTEEEATFWEEKKLKLVRLRVFNVLKNWLELYYNDDDSVLLDRLMEFTEKHIKSTLKFSNGQLESLIQKRKEGVAVDNVGLKKMVLTLPDPPEPISPKNLKKIKLMDIDVLEMARQLTIMDFKLYSSIRPIECLDKAWSREDDTVASNIRASIEYCNQITSWVSDVILSQQDMKKRSVMIKYWVQVAEKCRMLNNFNTCMAILSAFDNSSVGRLKRTWEAVGARTNQVLQQIRKLMGANRNFTEYRALIHSVNPPCIPFLGIYLQDLTFIEDGNSNELKKNKELINFAKRAKTAEVIREIQQYQSSLYQLKPVEEIQDFIKSHLLSTRDEEQLYNESLKIEPREREDEKITRLLQESGFLANKELLKAFDLPSLGIKRKLPTANNNNKKKYAPIKRVQQQPTRISARLRGKSPEKNVENVTEQDYKSRIVESLDEEDQEEFLKLMKNTLDHSTKKTDQGVNDKAILDQLNELRIHHAWITVKVTPQRFILQTQNSWDVRLMLKETWGFGILMDKMKKIFDMNKAKFETLNMGSEQYPITSLDIQQDGHLIWFSTSDGEIGFVDKRKGGEPIIYQSREKKVSCIHLNPVHQELLAVGSNDRTVTIWDTRRLKRNKKPLQSFEHGYSVTSCYWSPKGDALATSSYDDYIRIFQLDKRKDIKLKSTIPHNNHTGRWVTNFRARWNTNRCHGLEHQHLAIGNMNQTVDIYSGESGKELSQLYDQDHITAIPSVAQFHPSTLKPTILTGNASGRMCVK